MPVAIKKINKQVVELTRQDLLEFKTVRYFLLEIMTP